VFTQERMALRSSLGRSLAAVGSPGPEQRNLRIRHLDPFGSAKKMQKTCRTSPSNIPHKKLWFRDLKRLGCP